MHVERLFFPLCTVLGLGVVACATTPLAPQPPEQVAAESTEAEGAGDEVGEAEVEEAAEEVSGERAAAIGEAAQERAVGLAESAKVYFMSEQRATKLDGAHPWHSATEEDGRDRDGYPVPWDEYAFPGGPSFEFTTHGEVPLAGKPARPDFDVTNHLYIALLDKMNIEGGVDLAEPSDLRVTLTSGPEAGQGASLTIMVETDMDSGVDTNHTVTVQVGVNEYQEVVMSVPIVTHAFE